MFRIDDPSAAAALPTPEAAGTEGYFTEGNPAGGVPATLVRGSWLNMIQEELRNIVVAAGLTPSKTALNQVLTAIQTLMQTGAPNVSAAGGTADALTAAYTPAVTALVNGMTLYVRAANANATSTPTFKADGTVAKTIVKGNGLALAAGDIAGAGHWCELQYDAALDKWVLLNPAAASTGFASSQTTNGYVKLPPAPGQTKGMIIQWGITSSIAAGSNVTVTFPIAFPTALLYVVASPSLGADTTTAVTAAVSGGGVTGTIVRNANGGGISFQAYWTAIGY